MLDILITIACIIILVLIWVMLYDTNRFVITKHIVKDKRIRKEARAVMLADLHNKQFGKDNERLLAAIEECKPDFILVAGDILTAKKGVSLEPAIHLMKELSARYPVYYGNGNHEHRLKLYPDVYGDMAGQYARGLEEAGITPLVNSHITLQDYGISALSGWDVMKEYQAMFPGIIAKRNAPQAFEQKLDRVAQTPAIPQPKQKPKEQIDKKSIDKEEKSSYSVVNNSAAPLNNAEQAVLDKISREPIFVDQVIENAGLPAGTVKAILTKLAVKGRIQNHPGGRVSRKS